MRNLEIKTRVPDWERIRTELGRLGARDDGPETQHDLFYAAPHGRLKLRLSSRDGAALIHYRREDAPRVRASDYTRVPVADGEALARLLDAALGRTGEVRKHRHLFWVDNVRVHLDEVEGLGRFLELEAVVDADHPDDVCRRRAEALLQAFGIAPEQRQATAYVDLLAGSTPPSR